jgi:hypothetical protein
MHACVLAWAALGVTGCSPGHARMNACMPALRMTQAAAGVNSNSAVGRRLRAATKVNAVSAAKRMHEAARLKALQRTPYPMVLARIKLLLERLQVSLACGQAGKRGE